MLNGTDVNYFFSFSGVLRRTISDIITVHKVLPTTENILKAFSEKTGYEGGEAHLRTTMKEMGFHWRSCRSNRAVLMERRDVVLARIRFLRQIRQYRTEGRPIVYTDETFLHSSHSTSKCWQSDDVTVNVPISKGERLIIVHAGSRQGFVRDAELMFKAKSSTGDYHDEMNHTNFMKWLRERLLPNLPANAVLVLDNAPYHNVQVDRCPTKSAKKADIQAWLMRNDIHFQQDMTKVELLEVCSREKPSPKFVLDTELNRHGHAALRLPPYHAELNPIELIWAKLKRYVSQRNLTFKFKDVRKLAEEAIEHITVEDWTACCEHSQREEERYWRADIVEEAPLERLVISVTSSDEGTDTASDLTDSEETDTASETEQ